MKSAASAWRIKKMRYRSAYDRADNPEHNCPQDRQMRMQQRLCDAARKETNNESCENFLYASHRGCGTAALLWRKRLGRRIWPHYEAFAETVDTTTPNN